MFISAKKLPAIHKISRKSLRKGYKYNANTRDLDDIWR